MKRPNALFRGLLLACLLFLLGEYVALTHLAPQYVLWTVQYAAGGDVQAQRAHLTFPLTTTLTGLHWVSNSPQSALHIQRAVIWPRWLSVPSRTLRVDRVQLDAPALRLTRTKDGTLLRPSLRHAATAGAGASEPRAPSVGTRSLPASWQVQIDALKVVDGVIEFVDERPVTPFHGILDHLSVIAGPMTVPLDRAQQLSFAARARVVGHGGHAAPVYCSGWLDLRRRDLQASCRLEPLALAAFEPYYQGPPEVRVYTTTFTLTSQWMARANELTARIQLELDNLSEGDLSVHGRTILDIKQVTSGADPRLRGEVSLTGPLDDPRRWQAEFLPGNDPTQQLVKRLLAHGVEMIRVLLWGHELHVHLASASQAKMTDIEAVSKEIQEALEILAVPIPEEVPLAPPAGESPPAPAAAPESTPELPAPSPPVPSVLPEPQASSPSASPAGEQPQGLTPTSPAGSP